MFYGVNWIFLLLNIRMLYRIRHIKDRLKVREEMTFIVTSWTVFCYMQYGFYFLEQANRHCNLRHSFTSVYVGTFWVIIIRDLTVLTITWYYIIKIDSLSVTQRLRSIEDGQRETHVHLFEFSSVILSVLPL